MPSHNSTYRRIMAHKVYVEEIERMVEEYHEKGEQGEVYAMDGKTIRGLRIKEEAGTEYLLSVYDVEQGKTDSHYRRDVTLREDATRMTIGNTAKVMASINNLVLALFKQAGFYNAAQARRWHSAHLSQAFALLVTPFS